MIYLELFLNFLKIGAFTFGGGYAMISLIRETALANGWLNDFELTNLIAVSESTPGPIAINMATFVGSSQGGLLGAILSTLGVILPSFIIILLIATLAKNLLKRPIIKSALSAMRPCICALILSTSLIMALDILFGIDKIGAAFSFDIRAVIILAMIVLSKFIWKKAAKKAPSPIALIVLSAILGMGLYSI